MIKHKAGINKKVVGSKPVKPSSTKVLGKVTLRRPEQHNAETDVIVTTDCIIVNGHLAVHRRFNGGNNTFHPYEYSVTHLHTGYAVDRHTAFADQEDALSYCDYILQNTKGIDWSFTTKAEFMKHRKFIKQFHWAWMLDNLYCSDGEHDDHIDRG